MALQVTGLERKFIIKKDGKDIQLNDPNPSMSPEDVIKFYASEYPELTTANVSGPKIEAGKAIFSIKEVVGTKG